MGVSHAVDKLFCVSSVRARYGVGAQENRHFMRVRSSQSLDDDLGGLGVLLESLRRKVEAFSIIEIIVEHQEVRV